MNTSSAQKKFHKLTEPLSLAAKVWHEFFIRDIFNISAGKQLIKADMTAGNTPFISASDSNNGLPVNEQGLPDFEYMVAYMKNLVAEQYRRYLAKISD